MVTFRVRASSLAEVAALLEGVLLTFDTRVAETDRAVANVVNSTWKGEDADLFAQQWEGWKASSAITRQAISALITKLYAAQSGYVTTEGSLKQGFNKRAVIVEKTVGKRTDRISGHVSAGREVGKDLARESETLEDDALYGPQFLAASIAAGGTGKSGPAADDEDAEKEGAEAT
ncbi:hypothetical protein ACSAGD_11515 [Paramicrobacterium sp. CJ85]|uniref:hypothetical protein n=1 Tax=Paramicrobacterium sp. CJ85 TaxID=3445355 RepID=UPI003F626BFA